MNNELKNTLDTARAAYDFLKRQHVTAEANKDAIIARRPALHQALNSAAERLGAAQVGNMRGVVADSEVADARAEHQTARDALVRQNEDEELAARAMNMAHEFQAAKQEVESAQTSYFAEIAKGIEKPLREDKKLRNRLISILSAYDCMRGHSSHLDGDLDRRQWEFILFECFPIPTRDEVRQAYDEFVKAHDPA